MKKLINKPEDIVAESLEGLAIAHSDILLLQPGARFVRRRTLERGKVALVAGGGSGHDPLHAGFVGRGMLDAACMGEIFTSPTPDQIVAAVNAVEMGAGTLLIVKNYDGDVMNFDMAAELCGHVLYKILVTDDVSIPIDGRSTGARGVAGTLIVEKIVGAAAEMGCPLDHLVPLGERVVVNTKSMGVALTSCTVPANRTPTFELNSDEMELGVGIHGERGQARVKLQSADEIARHLVSTVLERHPVSETREVLVLINGFGATPLIELNLMARSVDQAVRRAGLRPVRYLVGNYVTALDMAGCSVSITRLDDELKMLWDAPVHTPALRWGC